MTPKPITTNTLFYADNLPIMRDYIADESVDLVYLDPPFYSNRSYNLLFKDESGHEEESQIEAFDDTWHWNDKTTAVYGELVTVTGGEVGLLVSASRQAIAEERWRGRTPKKRRNERHLQKNGSAGRPQRNENAGRVRNDHVTRAPAPAP
jgi:hypothetical protein